MTASPEALPGEDLPPDNLRELRPSPRKEAPVLALVAVVVLCAGGVYLLSAAIAIAIGELQARWRRRRLDREADEASGRG